MKVDLDSIYKHCLEVGFDKVSLFNDSVEVELKDNIILEVANIDDWTDSLIGFKGTPTHSHDMIIFCNRDGSSYIEMNYKDVITNLKSGKILIATMMKNAILKDRNMIHQDAMDIDLTYFNKDEYLIIAKV
jgi:hypothetical protein